MRNTFSFLLALTLPCGLFSFEIARAQYQPPLLPVLLGHSQYQNPVPPVPLLDDELTIKLKLRELMFALRRGDKTIAQSIFPTARNTSASSKMESTPLATKHKVSFENFTITVRNLRFNQNSSIVTCDVSDGNNLRLEGIKISFARVNRVWKIEDAPSLLGVANSIESQPNTLLSTASSATILMTDRALIGVRHPFTPTSDNCFVLNANYTVSKIQRRLFSDNTRLDLDGLLIDSTATNFIAFNLDPFWDRIVYGQKSGNWIKSYGDDAGDYKLRNLGGIAIDNHDTVYAADSENRRIVKLVFDRGISKLRFVTSFSLPGIDHPSDIAISLDGEPCCVSLDKIWVADNFVGKIVQIDRSGVIQKTIEYYTVGGQTYRLARPRKMLASEAWSNSPYLGFIDADRNAFVLADPNSITGTTITAIRSTEFTQTGSRLTCIGFDGTFEWWVGDAGLGKLHHFSWNGTYLASIDYIANVGTRLFNTPHSLSKVVYYIDNTQTRGILNLFASDPWGNTTGISNFLPGADVVGINVVATTSGANCYFTLTNISYLKVKILRASDGAVVATLFDGVEIAGPLSYSASLTSCTSYKLRVEVLPYHNSKYGSDAVQWLVKEYPFKTAGTFSVSISGPSVAPCATGTWTANVSCGTPPYSYKWYHMWDCGVTASTQTTDAAERSSHDVMNFTAKASDQTTDEVEPMRPCGSWTQVGTNSPTLQMYLCGGNSFLRVEVTDAKGSFASAQYYVAGAGGSSFAKSSGGDDPLQNKIPTAYALEQNYPNPFNPATIIKYQLPQDAPVTLKLYNLLGQEVATLVDEAKPAGYYEASLDASRLASGVYFYRMVAGRYSALKKIVVMK